MRSLGFLVSRRWAVFALVVVLLAWAAWFLGQWQFHRLEDRKARNAIIERNESAPWPRSTTCWRRVATVDPDDQWRLVTATGTYAVDDTVVVRYRTRDGASGIDVVVPLETAEGPSLLVDRGWMAADNRGADPDDVPAPPADEVTVTGWVRVDATGDSTAVTDQSTRAISSERIGEALDREVYGGFVDLRSEDPAPRRPWSRSSSRSSTTARTSSTGCSGGSSACSQSSASATWRTTSGASAARTALESPQHPAVDRKHHAADERRGRREQERRGPAELLRLAVAAQRDRPDGRLPRRLGVAAGGVELGHPLGGRPGPAAGR